MDESKDGFERILGRSEYLADVLQSYLIMEPKPIQRAAIRYFRDRENDVVVRGKKGCGKTYAYLIYIMEYCHDRSDFYYCKPYESIIVILPTTELCKKVSRVLNSWLKFREMRKVNVVTLKNQTFESVDFQRRPNFIASTPDCLLSCIVNGFIPSQVLRKSAFKLIIDDVDELLLDGNESRLNKIVALVPKSCRCILISNDPSGDLKQLINFVRTPPYVITLPESDSTEAEVISYEVPQYYVNFLELISCNENDKPYVFFRLWWSEFFYKKVAVFTNSNETGRWLKLFLQQFAVKSEVISFESPSTSHQQILQDFNDGLFNFLILADDNQSKHAPKIESNEESPLLILDSECGLLKKIHDVLNYDMPCTASGYFLRINSNGEGDFEVISMVTPEEDDISVFEEVKSHLLQDSKFIGPYQEYMTWAVGVKCIERVFEAAKRRMGKDIPKKMPSKDADLRKWELFFLRIEQEADYEYDSEDFSDNALCSSDSEDDDDYNEYD